MEKILCFPLDGVICYRNAEISAVFLLPYLRKLKLLGATKREPKNVARYDFPRNMTYLFFAQV